MDLSPDEPAPAGAPTPATLEKLALRHYDRLLRFVHSRLPIWMERVVDPEDVLQETFARAFKSFHTFHANGDDSFFAWSSRIAENHINNLVDFYRARKRFAGQHDFSLDATSSNTAVAILWKMDRGRRSPSDIAANAEKVEQLSACLKRLDPVYQEVLQHRYLHGRSARATAELMGRSERAIEQLVFRAVRQLRRLFPRSRP